MIINCRKQYIFIHIPKCAGESISRILIRYGGTPFLRKHSPARLAARELRDDYFSFFSFAIVRNPWDQVVSFYEHLRKPLYEDHKALQRQYPDFDGFLNPKKAGKIAIESDFSTWCKAIYGDRVDNDHSFNDLTYFSHDEKGEQLVTFIGRYESLNEDFDYIISNIGKSACLAYLKPRLPLLNKSRRRSYREYYSPYTRNIVGSAFCNSVETFGYEF